jgi:hypothetical protein
VRTFRDGDTAAGRNSSQNSIHAGLSTKARGSPAPATSRTTDFSKSCCRAGDHESETIDSRECRRTPGKEFVRERGKRLEPDSNSEGAGLLILEPAIEGVALIKGGAILDNAGDNCWLAESKEYGENKTGVWYVEMKVPGPVEDPGIGGTVGRVTGRKLPDIWGM